MARVVLAMIYEASKEQGHADHHAEAVAVVREIRGINPELTAEQAVRMIPAGDLLEELGPRGVAWLQRAGLP